MILKNVEVSNFNRVVLNRTVVWIKSGIWWQRRELPTREGIRFIGHEELCRIIKTFDNRSDYKIWISGDVINILKRGT